MTLQMASDILDKFTTLCDVINQKIGVLKATKSVSPISDNEISISIRCNDVKHNNVGLYLLTLLDKSLLASEYNQKYFYVGGYNSVIDGIEEKGINLVIDLKGEAVSKCSIVYRELIENLYFTVVSATVEFGFHIEACPSHEVAPDIFWELDTWNEGWIDDGEKDKCASRDDIKCYRFKKDWLYSISLGYYTINLDLFETDVVPELIGVLFDSTEDFCYITSYEDEENIYVYSVKELDDNNTFDLEEGLFNLLSNISFPINVTKTDETLEELYIEIER